MGMGSSFGGQAVTETDLRELPFNWVVSSVSNLEIPEGKTETGWYSWQACVIYFFFPLTGSSFSLALH